MLQILSINALTTLHDLAKSCKKLGKIHMLQILSATLHDLAKSCKKLGKILMPHILSILALNTLHDLAKIHMLQILSILALATLHDLAKSCKKLGKIMHGLVLPRCLAMYFQDHSRSCRVMQDIFARAPLNFLPSP